MPKLSKKNLLLLGATLLVLLGTSVFTSVLIYSHWVKKYSPIDVDMTGAMRSNENVANGNATRESNTDYSMSSAAGVSEVYSGDYLSEEDLKSSISGLTSEEEKFLTIEVDESLVKAGFDDTYVDTSHVSIDSLSASDEDLIMLSENDAWALISGGKYTSYPSGTFNENASILHSIKSENEKVITVPIWYWKNPSNKKDLEKISTTKSFVVNKNIAQLFEHAFNDIYNHPDKPIINIGDYGMGTWVLRGKNHNGNARMSTHALGCCIDINPCSGSFKVNGTWYGNGYNQQPMSRAIWEQLPECHQKYHVLYAGSPIVEIFKSYGFVWGGDWTSCKDCMHLSWIGEGSNCRENGQKNYLERK